MKSFKFFAMAAFLAVATSASAQTKETSTASEGWSSVYVQWSPSSMDYKKHSESFTGLSVGYNQAFKILADKPLYIEGGIALQYSFDSDDLTEDIFDEDMLDLIYEFDLDADIERKMSLVSLKIPVNLTYKFDLPSSPIAIAPFAGLLLRANLIGTQRLSIGGDLADEMSDKQLEKLEESMDLFSDDDMGKDGTWNRFQLGWQIGANVYFGGKYYAGISYGTDFSEIYKKTKISTTSITLGYCF